MGFEAIVDDTPTTARGQTTLDTVKRDYAMLIVQDHTSVVQTVKQGQPEGHTSRANGTASNPPPT